MGAGKGPLGESALPARGGQGRNLHPAARGPLQVYVELLQESSVTYGMSLPSSHPHTLQVYAELRRESSVTHGMPIAVRHLESMIRMAEARAGMHLRDHVTDDDLDCAIKWVLFHSPPLSLHPAPWGTVMLESWVCTQQLSVCPPPPLPRVMLESFVSTQKLSVQKALRRKFRRFIVAKADFDQLVLFKLQVGGLVGLVGLEGGRWG